MRQRQTQNFKVNDLRKLDLEELLTIWFYWNKSKLNENSNDGKLICTRVINKLENVLEEKDFHWFRIAKTFVPSEQLKNSDRVSQFYNIQNVSIIKL